MMPLFCEQIIRFLLFLLLLFNYYCSSSSVTSPGEPTQGILHYSQPSLPCPEPRHPSQDVWEPSRFPACPMHTLLLQRAALGLLRAAFLTHAPQPSVAAPVPRHARAVPLMPGKVLYSTGSPACNGKRV